MRAVLPSYMTDWTREGRAETTCGENPAQEMGVAGGVMGRRWRCGGSVCLCVFLNCVCGHVHVRVCGGVCTFLSVYRCVHVHVSGVLSADVCVSVCGAS